jgi:hypothetical protein
MAPKGKAKNAAAAKPKLNPAFAQGLSPGAIQSLEARLAELQAMKGMPLRVNAAGDLPPQDSVRFADAADEQEANRAALLAQFPLFSDSLRFNAAGSVVRVPKGQGAVPAQPAPATPWLQHQIGGVIQPPQPAFAPIKRGERQREFVFQDDRTRPLFIHPIPIEEAIDVAANRGLPYGASIGEWNDWHDMGRSQQMINLWNNPHRDELLANMRQMLLSEGVEGANVVPLARGEESAVFATPDGRVIKVGTPTGRFTYQGNYDSPQGVWGVLPIKNRRVEAGAGQPDPAIYDILFQDKAILGKVKQADISTLTKALRDQGWIWDDNHRGNIGKRTHTEYSPVVIDGPVYPQRRPADDQGRTIMDPDAPNAVKREFVPPTGPMYSVPGAIPAAQLGGSMPQPIAGNQSPEWAFDGSMAISPTEWRNWENAPSQGYGGPEHQAHVKAIDEALDIPSISGKYVQSLGVPMKTLQRYLPGYEGGDVSMRQFMQAAPEIAARQAFLRYMSDKTPESEKSYLAAMHVADNPSQVMHGVYASLTGTKHDRNDPNTRAFTGMVLDAVKAGTPGQPFEDAPDMAQSEFEQLNAKHGEEANRMLTPGGENNHRRLAVYELASTLQDGEHAPRGVTTTQAIGNGLFGSFDVPGLGGPADRFNDLMDPSGPRGRIKITAPGWQKNKGDVVWRSQLPAEQKARFGGPTRVNGEEFEAYNPRTWDGTVTQATNASFPAGRNIYRPWNSVMGDMGTAASLLPGAVSKDGVAGVIKPFQFLQQSADANNRITPIRPDSQTPEEFATSRKHASEWDDAKGGWISANVGPAMMEVHGHKRQYLPRMADAIANTPGSILENPYELAGVAAPAFMSGGRFGRAAAAEVLDEAGENLTQGPVLSGLLSGDFKGAVEGAVRSPKTNTYLLPRADGSQVQAADDDYWQQLDRSKQEWDRRNKARYDQWDNRQ